MQRGQEIDSSVGRAEGETIKAITWNVHGSKHFREIEEFLEEYDIVILQETWLDKEKADRAIKKLSDKYMYWVKEAIRKNEGKKRGRLAGGQIVGIKKDVMNGWMVCEWKGGQIIKHGKKECIISVYVNEGIHKIERKLYEVIEECMNECELIIVCGDMNARIGEANAGVIEEGEVEIGNERKSEDKKIDEEGKKILRMCEELGMTVLNGRINGDRKGRITYIGGGEEYAGSVLDLVMIVDRGNLEEVNSLKVIERNESDHLPVGFEFGSKKKEEKGEEGKDKGMEKIQWKKEKAGEFTKEIAKKVRGEDWEKKGYEWERIKEMIWETTRETEMATKGRTGRKGRGRRWTEEMR